MGDLAELRGIILVMTFLSCFFIISSSIPTQYYYSIILRKDVDIPDFIEANEIIQFNYSAIESLHSSEAWTAGGNEYFLESNIGGHDIKFSWDLDTQYIFIHHVIYWWIFKTNEHKMKWYYEGKEIPQADTPGITGVVYLTEIIDYFDNGTAHFRVQCDHTGFDLTIAYNTTAYTSFTEAFNNNDFWFIVGMTIDDIKTKLSAWDLIGRLLFFQMPEIHPVLNMIIAIPVWTCISYLIYVLVLKAIPFVGG